jgi:hypothetical protein
MLLGIGARKTCQRLWEAIPQEYRQGHCFADFLRVYVAVIPEEQHTPVGPRDGRNRPCRALEQHATSTLGPLCPHDSLVFPRPRSCTKPVSCSSFTAII